MFQHPNHRSARRRRGTARNGKLIRTNNEGKLPNLGKEIDFREVQEAQSPKEIGPKEEHTRHIIIKLPKMKYKERILKTSRETETITYKGVPIRLSGDFSKETFQGGRLWEEVFKVMKDKDLHPRYSLQQSYHLEWKGR